MAAVDFDSSSRGVGPLGGKLPERLPRVPRFCAMGASVRRRGWVHWAEDFQPGAGLLTLVRRSRSGASETSTILLLIAPGVREPLCGSPVPDPISRVGPWFEVHARQCQLLGDDPGPLEPRGLHPGGGEIVVVHEPEDECGRLNRIRAGNLTSPWQMASCEFAARPRGTRP